MSPTFGLSELLGSKRRDRAPFGSTTFRCSFSQSRSGKGWAFAVEGGEGTALSLGTGERQLTGQDKDQFIWIQGTMSLTWMDGYISQLMRSLILLRPGKEGDGRFSRKISDLYLLPLSGKTSEAELLIALIAREWS